MENLCRGTNYGDMKGQHPINSLGSDPGLPILNVYVETVNHHSCSIRACLYGGEFPGQPSFPARRVSRLGEFPGMYRKCTVLHFIIYMNSRETRLSEIPPLSAGIPARRVSRLFM